MLRANDSFEKEKEKADSTKSTDTNLNLLPTEILTHALSFVSTADRVRAGRVNRFFATAARSSSLPSKAEKFYAVGLPIPLLEDASFRVAIPEVEIKHSFSNLRELRFFKTLPEAQNYIDMSTHSSRFIHYADLKKLNYTPGIMTAMISPTFLHAYTEEVRLNCQPEASGEKEMDCSGLILDEWPVSLDTLVAVCPREEIYPISYQVADFPVITVIETQNNESEKYSFCLTM